jgi:3-oxoacyl-(acyl-carrier-protein) synthase
MTNRIVITGIGTLTPAGRGIEALWAGISTGDTFLSQIDPENYFDPSPYACQVAGQVSAFSEPRVLTPGMLAQTDRCSQLALVAVLDALDMAQLPIDFRSEGSPVSAERVSLTIATIGAGWTYVEREMRNLWTQGVGAMDRFGLTAGFPAGPQGHVSIFFGVEGRTRTFVSERTSGAQALIEGAKTIQRGDAEVAIVGGTEAPLTSLTWAAYHSSHMLQPVSQVKDLVHTGQPFVGEHTGMLVGEGSTFLILEEREHALHRGIPILAEIRGWNRGTDSSTFEGSSTQPGRGLARGIRSSLVQADILPSGVDVLFPAGSTLKDEEEAEEAALSSVFEQSPMTASSKAILGNLLSAEIATEVAIATLMLDRQTVPLPNVSPDQTSGEHSKRSLQHALVLSSGLGGTYASLLVSKAD